MYARCRERNGKRTYKKENRVLSVTSLKKEHVCGMTPCCSKSRKKVQCEGIRNKHGWKYVFLTSTRVFPDASIPVSDTPEPDEDDGQFCVLVFKRCSEFVAGVPGIITVCGFAKDRQ